jgi:hypothetical protein
LIRQFTKVSFDVHNDFIGGFIEQELIKRQNQLLLEELQERARRLAYYAKYPERRPVLKAARRCRI